MGLRDEQHPNWKGGRGISKSKNRWEYVEWRKAVFDKWGNSCALCGRTAKEKSCLAHHIKPVSKYPHLAFVPSNGTVLCRICHSGLHFTSTYLENGENSEKALLVKKLISSLVN